MSEEKDSDPAAPTVAEDEAATTAVSDSTEDGEEAEEKVPYEVLEQNPVEGSVLQFKISVPRESHDARLEELFKDLGSTVSIEGFRRGKAPRKLLQIRFGKEVGDDAVNSLAGNVIRQIVEKDALDPVSEPEIESWALGENDGPLEIVVKMEIRPKLTISGYERLEVEIEERAVTEEMVDGHLEEIRQSSAQFKTAPEGAKFNPGDGAVIDYEVLDAQGNPLTHLCRTDCFEQQLMERVPPALAEKLAGLAPGETIEAQVESMRRTRRGEERASVDAHRLTLKEIKVRELPELDDEFAKDLGEFDSLDELKSRIREDLQRQVDARSRDETMSKIYDALLEANPFDAPRTMVAGSALDMLGGAARRLAAYGVRFQDMPEDSQKNYVDSAQRDAERGVKINLVIDAIARQEKIEVGEADVEQAIERMAESEGRRPLAVRARLERERRLDQLRTELMVDKVNDLLLTRASVKKVPPAPDAEAETEVEDTDKE